MPEQRKGVLLAAGAYLSWGFLPLYWPLLKPAGAVEILAHRFIWSLVTVALLVAVLRRFAFFRTLTRDRRLLGALAFAAVLITINWGTYIYAVNTGHVVEASLGYFINPLMSVALGVMVLGERLRPVQWAAVGIGTTAVLVLTVDYGRPPWIALALSATFALYGLVKKRAAAPALEGLATESAVMTGPMLAYAAWLQLTGDASFGHVSWGHTALMVGTGVITAVPLLLFAAGVNRVPLSTIGLMQYLAPIIQFALGVTFFGEHMPPARWAGFGLVWLALIVFTADAVRHHRRQLARAAESVA